MKKFFALLLALMMLMSFAACSSGTSSNSEGLIAPSIGDSGYPSGAFPEKGDVAAPGEVADGEDIEFDADVAAGAEADGDKNNTYPSAGLLTAGEWRDVENLDFWKNLLNRNDRYQLMARRNLYTNSVKVVSVKTPDGDPCYNAEVVLHAEDGSVIYTARTDVWGKAYLFYNLNKNGKTPKVLRVNSNTFAELSEGVTEVVISSESKNVEALDLMFTIDTTGSMSDELRYLQSELEDVIDRVAKSSGNVLSIRVSVNFYRDTTDDYVVLPFDFTSNMVDVMNTLRAQSAIGGGDYPEAVHTALDNAILEHEWREDAVKLMFLVLDAPPHSEAEIQGVNRQIQESVTKAAEMGIKIIPVASSGVDTETEFLLRSYAAMTGGTYIFLTNHSGIGGDHLEPTIGQYAVEPLNECLIRIISEYCGLVERVDVTVDQSVTAVEFYSLVSWANWSDAEEISSIALNKDKLLNGGSSHLPIYLLNSIEELEAFKSRGLFEMDQSWDEIGSFNEVTTDFGDEFFKEKSLLIVYVGSNSCTPRFDAESVVISGDTLCVDIVQTNDPEDFDEAMGGWLIIVSVPKAQLQNVKHYDAE